MRFNGGLAKFRFDIICACYIVTLQSKIKRREKFNVVGSSKMLIRIRCCHLFMNRFVVLKAHAETNRILDL